MKKLEKLDQLVSENNGYLLTSAVVEQGISKTYLAHFVESRNMERVAHGIYLAEDAWPDSLYLLSLKNQEIIFSHETAMYLFGMTDREPTKITVTIHSGYNASHLRKNHIKVYTVNNNVFQLGKTEIKTIFGNPVAAYDPDRSLCDIIKNKSDLEVQIFNTIMNEYMKSPDKNLGNLMKYASILGIDDKVRLYTEVML